MSDPDPDIGKYVFSDEEEGESVGHILFDTRKEALKAAYLEFGEDLEKWGGSVFTGQIREKTEDEEDNEWDCMIENVEEHEAKDLVPQFGGKSK